MFRNLISTNGIRRIMVREYLDVWQFIFFLFPYILKFMFNATMLYILIEDVHCSYTSIADLK